MQDKIMFLIAFLLVPTADVGNEDDSFFRLDCLQQNNGDVYCMRNIDSPDGHRYWKAEEMENLDWLCEGAEGMIENLHAIAEEHGLGFESMLLMWSDGKEDFMTAMIRECSDHE